MRPTFFWMVGLSLLLHGILLRFVPDRTPRDEVSWIEVEPEEAIAIESAPPAADDAPDREQRVVESETLENEKTPVESRYLSDRDRSVTEETRAAKTDKFNGETRRRDGAVGEAGPSEALSMKDLGIGGPKEWVGGLEAATDDRLEGIPVGERTALNTREFRYHSFYVRVKEQMRQTWKPEVERRAEKLFLSGHYPVGKELVTRVIVYLDAEGNVVKVERVRSSGTAAIDEAAELAFRRVGVLPNPPEAMIDRDGLVRLHWEFIVQANEAPELRVAKGDERELQNRDRRDL